MSQYLSFIVFGADNESLNRLDTALAASGRASLLSSAQSARQIRADISRLRPAAAIIVLSEAVEEELSLLRDLATVHPETMLIGAAENASPDLILNSLRAGASEFLRLPLNEDEFSTVLDHAQEYAARQMATPRKRGRVIAVFSNKGGCGTSFLAANLAVALGAPTVLVDLNFQIGDIGFFFRIEPKFSILNLHENLERMDEELLSGLLTSFSPMVSILPAPTDVDEALEVRGEHVTAALDLLRSTYDFVVLDLPHTFDEVALAAFDYADEILVVTTLDIMAVRNMQRVVAVLERLDYPKEKVRVVVNRWNRNDLDVGLPHVEKLFGKDSLTMIPNDYRAVAASVNLGEPLVVRGKSSSVANEIKRLAGSLVAAANRDSLIANGAAGLSAKAGKANGAPAPASQASTTSSVDVQAGINVEQNGKGWKGKISSLLRTG
jgi:pilus assembly protein CpaE